VLKHHFMKAYGSGSKAPRILNLDNRWRRVVRSNSRLITPRERAPGAARWDFLHVERPQYVEPANGYHGKHITATCKIRWGNIIKVDMRRLLQGWSSGSCRRVFWASVWIGSGERLDRQMWPSRGCPPTFVTPSCQYIVTRVSELIQRPNLFQEY
jgi:hypothetical protein